MGIHLLNSAAIWLLLLAPLTLFNGFVREKLLVPWLGRAMASPLSVLTLSVLVFACALVVVQMLGTLKPVCYWLTGFLWVVLTVSMEFLFGHYILGYSIEELTAAYRIWRGEAWPVAIVVLASAPYIAAKLRRLA